MIKTIYKIYTDIKNDWNKDPKFLTLGEIFDDESLSQYDFIDYISFLDGIKFETYRTVQKDKEKK